MDKRALRTSDKAKEIIEHNTNIIYHLPKKYVYLEKALKNVRYDLLKLFQFCRENDPIIWKQKYTWFIDNKRLTMIVRERTTAATSNRHFNFLCCIGVITKLKQTDGSRTGVNATFLLNERENGKIRDINTFTIYKYTEKKLEEIEQRAKMLVEHKITPGNISNDKLKASGLPELASEVFYANSKTSIHKKEEQFQKVLKQLEKLCDEKGYTTKKELCKSLNWSRDKLDKLLNIFKETWQQQYQYKAPNKKEKEEYNIDTKKWIIIRR